ncbi:MAG TPA: FCD domain-containing protein [Trebonia sp.]|jgi:DNA-binding FadR family transcriptional regulator|nr:FCD domain-containing protein [Trebonia sp.]
MSEAAPAFGPIPDARAAAHRIPKMAQVIAAELRGKILRGDFKPGDSLFSEATLMEQYDVSRPTLREALRLLEAQNLISVRRGSHRGPVVSLPDASVTARAVAIQLQLREATLADVYQFRMIYEPTAARMAAENATPEGVKALRAIVDEEAQCQGNYKAFAEVSWRFHSVLIGLSNNATMAVVTESLQHISEQQAAKGMSVALDRDEQQARSVKAHRKIVDLIEKGAGAEAERFWARHMAAVADVQRSWLEDQSVTELLD